MTLLGAADLAPTVLPSPGASESWRQRWPQARGRKGGASCPSGPQSALGLGPWKGRPIDGGAQSMGLATGGQGGSECG